MTLQEYMNGTEYALRQLFNSLVHYQDLIAECMSPSFSGTIDFDGTHDDIRDAFIKHYNESHEFREKQEYASVKFDEYLANSMAHASICGSILQMAHMGISLFSKPQEECQCLTGKHTKFGIGRIVRTLPIGLIIYAGRNQYNHWDEEPKEFTRCIFEKIASPYDDLDDKHPSFDLENSHNDIYSHNILGLLEWRTYEDYERDMKDMLNNQETECTA